MRRKFTAALVACLAISTLVFSFLWIAEKGSKENVRELAQAEAVRAHDQFAMYQDDGDVSGYWNGVAAFWAFEQAYCTASRGTNSASNYQICSEVYGYLVGEPERSQAYIADIVEIMGVLSKDIEDLSGYARMLDLRNKYLYEA